MKYMGWSWAEYQDTPDSVVERVREMMLEHQQRVARDARRNKG